MSYPKAEWEGSSHFSNAKGIKAECADCHIPQEGLHYLKAKVVALKDVWYTITNKLPNQEAYESQRLAMAQRVWDEMKANDSATCKTCHKPESMILSDQKPAAQKMHQQAQTSGETCIDCHKGLVHFMPEMPKDTSANQALTKTSGQFSAKDRILNVQQLATAILSKGGEARVMPFAELYEWQEQGEMLTATMKGWQQEGAESVLYLAMGKRIMLALLDEEAQSQLTVAQTVKDEVTDSNWKEVSLAVSVPKSSVTANLASLNQYGNQLNQSYCSGCHAPIGAEHYTANQWIGVVNSMKDRTAMTADEVRAVTIYLQRNAKDMVQPAK